MLFLEADHLYYWLHNVYIKCILYFFFLHFSFLHDLDCYVKSSLSCYLARSNSLMIQCVPVNSPSVLFITTAVVKHCGLEMSIASSSIFLHRVLPFPGGFFVQFFLKVQVSIISFSFPVSWPVPPAFNFLLSLGLRNSSCLLQTNKLFCFHVDNEFSSCVRFWYFPFLFWG